MRNRKGTVAVLVSAALAAVLAGASAARAQDDGTIPPPPDDRVALTAHGLATVNADTVDIEFVVQATSEDATDAEKKQRDKLNRVMKALRALKASLDEKRTGAAPGGGEKGEKNDAPGDKAPGDKEPEKPAKKKKPADDGEDAPKKKGKNKPVDDDDEEDGAAKKKGKKEDDDGPDPPTFTVELREARSMIGVARADGNPAQTPSITVATAIIIRMEGIADVARPKLRKRLALILDKAIESGADGGGADSGSQPTGTPVRPAFRFRLKDNEPVREAAYEKAMKAGRKRAAALARLAGRELGPLSTVKETSWSLRAGNPETAAGFDIMLVRMGNNRPNNHDLLTSTTEIELEVALALEFELGKPTALPPETAAPGK